MKYDLKIFVSHRIDLDSKKIDESIYFPVRCGAYFDPNINTIIGDDTGDNISHKRDSYCELTVQYWAWKNIKADYYGLCHYRRYLSSSQIDYVRGTSEKDNGCILMDFISPENIVKYGLDSESIQSLVEEYDVICCEDIKVRKLNNYDLMVKHFEYHNVDDMYLAIDILKRKYPDFSEIADEYMKSNSTRLYNCFIMKSDIFNKYSSWLFDILFELEKHLDMSSYGFTKYRTPGTIGERLFGIYILYLQREKKYLIKEVPLVFIKDVSHNNLPLNNIDDNNISIVTLLEDNDISIYMTSLISILSNISIENNYDINILSFDLSDSSKRIIENEVKKYKNVSIRFYNPMIFLGKTNSKSINPEYLPLSFAKILLPYIFINHDKILFIEYNALCLKDIALFFNYNIKDHYVGAVEDIIKYGELNSHSQKIESEIIKDKIYFNCNVILLNCHLIRENWDLDIIKSKIIFSPDTISVNDILNSLLSTKVLLVDNNWNIMTNFNSDLNKKIELAPRDLFFKYKIATEDPYIINYHNDDKPWDYKTKINDFSLIWWKYTKNNPFYEKIIQNFSFSKDRELSLQELFFDIVNYRFNLVKLLMLKFLSLVSFRKIGENKLKNLRVKIKKVRKLRKTISMK